MSEECAGKIREHDARLEKFKTSFNQQEKGKLSIIGRIWKNESKENFKKEIKNNINRELGNYIGYVKK